MGLDMYLYRINKVTEEDIEALTGTHIDDVPEGFNCMTRKDFDERASEMDELLPYVKLVKMRAQIQDTERFYEDFGIDFDDEVVALFGSYESQEMTFMSGKKVCISREEALSYYDEKEVDVYVWKQERIAYWRNAHDLDMAFRQARMTDRLIAIAETGQKPTQEDAAEWQVENCAFNHMSMGERAEVNEFLQATDDEYANEKFWFDEKQNLFYVAWW